MTIKEVLNTLAKANELNRRFAVYGNRETYFACIEVNGEEVYNGTDYAEFIKFMKEWYFDELVTEIKKANFEFARTITLTTKTFDGCVYKEAIGDWVRTYKEEYTELTLTIERQ